MLNACPVSVDACGQCKKQVALAFCRRACTRIRTWAMRRLHIGRRVMAQRALAAAWMPEAIMMPYSPLLSITLSLCHHPARPYRLTADCVTRDSNAKATHTPYKSEARVHSHSCV
jgi:hypothetical protein